MYVWRSQLGALVYYVPASRSAAEALDRCYPGENSRFVVAICSSLCEWLSFACFSVALQWALYGLRDDRIIDPVCHRRPEALWKTGSARPSSSKFRNCMVNFWINIYNTVCGWTFQVVILYPHTQTATKRSCEDDVGSISYCWWCCCSDGPWLQFWEIDTALLYSMIDGTSYRPDW